MSCPALGLDRGAGLADVLTALDCRTGEATQLAFGRLFGAQGALLPALTALLTIYVAIFAIGLLTGRTRLGVGALTPRMLTLGLALTFATSWMAYQNVVWTLATGAPDQIASVLAGTRGSATHAFAERIDTIFDAISDAAAQTQASAPVQTGAATAAASAPVANPASTALFTPSNLLWLSALMLLVGTVGVLVTAKIALAALLAVGPVFVVMALFRATRGLFEGWLKAAVLFALVPMFAVLIGGGTLAMIVPLVRAAILETGSEATRATVALFLAATVYCALMVMVVKTAGTIVAGWRLPGSDRGREGDTATQVAPIVAAAVPAQSTHSSSATVTDPRVRAIVAGLPAPANDSDRGVGASRTTAIVRAIDTSSLATPIAGPRPTGVGSSFRRTPITTPRPISRDRLP